MSPKKYRLSAFEMLPDNAREIVQQALDAITSRRMPQTRAYDLLAQRLKEIGIPNNEVKRPSFSAFNRLVVSGRSVSVPAPRATAEDEASYPLSVSDETRSLLATAFRALADDLDGGKPQKDGGSDAEWRAKR